jgi:hypothetical protein
MYANKKGIFSFVSFIFLYFPSTCVCNVSPWHCFCDLKLFIRWIWRTHHYSCLFSNYIFFQRFFVILVYLVEIRKIMWKIQQNIETSLNTHSNINDRYFIVELFKFEYKNIIFNSLTCSYGNRETQLMNFIFSINFCLYYFFFIFFNNSEVLLGKKLPENQINFRYAEHLSYIKAKFVTHSHGKG